VTHFLSDENRYRLLKYLDEHPNATQRELARELGISLGKANYCLRALIEKGWVKLRNFKNSENKSAYSYILTRHGLQEKMNVTVAFLRRKVAEYNASAREIELLREEVRLLTGSVPDEITGR